MPRRPPDAPRRWPWLLLTLAACALFVSLGRWQWQRGEYRAAQWQGFEAAAAEPRETALRELGTLPRFTRVRVVGHFDVAHEFLLDNISEGGRAGYYVLTPLRDAGGRAVLVNRGWVPGTGRREVLPDTQRPSATAEPVRIVARTGVLPVAGIERGRVPPPADGPWPRVASFPADADLAAALPYALEPGVLLLDPAEAAGGTLARQWRPPGLEPARHFSYAVQWWAFAALALVLFVLLNFRRKKSSP